VHDEQVRREAGSTNIRSGTSNSSSTSSSSSSSSTSNRSLVDVMNLDRVNPKYLPGHRLPTSLIAHANMSKEETSGSTHLPLITYIIV
jgi:hypothetical protein